MKKLIYIFLLIATPVFSQTNYYVDQTGGSDTNDGLSTSTAWQTLTKVTGETFNPGDSILFKYGEVWRTVDEGSLNTPSSGTADSYITFSAYGDSDLRKPLILGSEQVSTWTNVSGNIWSASLSFNPDDRDVGAELFCEVEDDSAMWGWYVAYTSGHTNMTVDLDWSWNSGTIYLYSTSDPDTRFQSVEAPYTTGIWNLVDKEYITINNFEIAYCVNFGISDSYAASNVSGLNVTNCHIHHIGVKNSASAYGLTLRRSLLYIGYNEIHDCGRRNISLTTYSNYPIMSIDSIIIEHNILRHGWHTTGLDFNTQGAHDHRNIHFRNNLIYDENVDLQDPHYSSSLTSNSMFIANQGTGYVGQFYIYNNIFHSINGVGILLENVDSIFVYNNTFYKYNLTIDGYYGFVQNYGTSNVDVANNIYYSNLDGNQGSTHIFSVGTTAAHDETDSDNNIWYAEDDNQRIYGRQGASAAYYDGVEWDDYVSEQGYDENSNYGDDPNFVDADNGDFSLENTSVAARAGIPISFIATDYYGNERDEYRPSAGAIENTYIDSTATEVVAFSIPLQISSSVSFSDSSISVKMPYGTDRSSLTAAIVVSTNGTINPTSGTSRDFTSTVTYTVTAANGTDTQIWSVTVTNQSWCETVTINPNGVITNDVLNTGVGAIQTNPSGGTSPYTYLWEDGETTSGITGLTADYYTVTITDDSSCFVTDSFRVVNTDPTVVDSIMINLTNSTYTYDGPGAINVTSEQTTFYVYDTIEVITSNVDAFESDGDTDIPDWDSDLSIITMYDNADETVTISNLDDSYDYTVRVLSSRSGANTRYQWTIVNGDSVYINTRDSDLTKKVSTHENVELEDGVIVVTASPVSDYAHINAIEIVMRDGDVDSTATDIITFSIPSQVSWTINSTNHTVSVVMPYGTSLISLVPTVAVSQGAEVSPESGLSQNFTSTVTYTVTAANGTDTQDWTITVTVGSPPATTSGGLGRLSSGAVMLRNGQYGIRPNNQ